ncbi:antibiotic biosynthesis monooxygenase family protein [Mesorhizobium sp. A556]
MVLEIAEFDIILGKETAFEAGVREAVPLFQAAKGYRSITLKRIVEKPGTYRLLVEWETLEDHTVTFRNSEAFQKWRSLVGSYFATTPRVDHSETIVEA